MVKPTARVWVAIDSDTLWEVVPQGSFGVKFAFTDDTNHPALSLETKLRDQLSGYLAIGHFCWGESAADLRTFEFPGRFTRFSLLGQAFCVVLGNMFSGEC